MLLSDLITFRSYGAVVRGCSGEGCAFAGVGSWRCFGWGFRGSAACSSAIADHDHVVADLAERFDSILENLEALGDWSTTKVLPGKIILGELGGIETGVRQLLRSRPLETTEVEVRGKQLVIPTAAEILRVKAWLALSRNQTRDYLDIAALAECIGLDEAAGVLRGIDDYYADINRRPEAVATQLVRQLADPRPRDAEVTDAAGQLQGTGSSLA